MLFSRNKYYFLKRGFIYLFTFISIGFCIQNFKSGPCTPNLDVLSWLVALLVSSIVLVKNMIQAIFTQKLMRVYGTFIHLAGLTLLYFVDAILKIL
ncbi:hypothetical protein AHMF7605_10790 [Adhaeribacter arboris]|uniref:Uncharacterized protein n=1 Tax=Adhaeribacter arboris TaxID=2072846 RepID=A0A2T2YEN6_9BACT|nr:hypothetical protein AHMF7605_10790 [Adhaeribacter arboris]